MRNFLEKLGSICLVILNIICILFFVITIPAFTINLLSSFIILPSWLTITSYAILVIWALIGFAMMTLGVLRK